MIDASPLLSHSDTAEHQNPPSAPLISKHQNYSLNDTIEHCIGDFGWTQFLQAMLISFTWFFDAQQTFITVFTDAQPKWTCSSINNSSSSCGENMCELPRDAWNWEFSAGTSTVSDWSLECSSSTITGLPASSFFAGCLAGGFLLATLADSSFGRKKMLVLACVIMSLSGVLTVGSVNVWMYAFLRFVSGFGRVTIGTSALVLSTELVGKKWRGSVGIIGFICFTLGFLSLPGVAYLLRGYSWRLIYLSTCIPSLCYSFLLYFCVHESPGWLFIRGRREEFVETLRSVASPIKRSGLTKSFFNSVDWEEKVQETDIYSALKMLTSSRWARRRLAAAMVVGFGMGMIYYGMPLGLGNLSFDLYISVTLNALSELPASFLTLYIVDKLNRKRSILALTLLSGVCSVTCVVAKTKVIQIVLELISFFCACTGTNVILIYTLELFPTCVRNSAVSMVRQAVVLSGVLSPVLVAAGRKNNGLLSYGVFGVTIGICGLFVACLPETRGRRLCDTMEEEEEEEEVGIA